MTKESKHAQTNELSRRLCDLLFTSIQHDTGQRPKFGANWCSVSIDQQSAVLYSVRHSQKHIHVFLACKDTPEVRGKIEALLPVGVMIRERPSPRKGNWAISTPFFIQ